MEQAPIQQLLQKLANGTLLPGERQQLQQLPPEALFPEAEWEAAVHDTQPVNALAAWHTVSGKIGLRKTRRLPMPTAAVMIGLLVTAGFFLFRQPAATPITVNTSAGQRMQLTLPDGSQLAVNGNSRVSYPANFKNREVTVTAGEAFFDVLPDAAHPFVVHTGKLEVKVLGTSFSVRNRPGHISVAVKTGKIAVNDRLLLPGRQAILTNILRESACNTAQVGSWQQDELVFEDASLQEILEEVHHNYGINYRCTDSTLLDKRFRAAFKQRETGDILRTLAAMANFKYTIKDSLITIH